MTACDPKLLTILGFGNIGQAIISVLRERFPSAKLSVVDRHFNPDQISLARKFNLELIKEHIRKDNYERLYSELLEEGSFLLNLATSISSYDSLAWAIKRRVHYIDTCIDPWEYADGHIASESNTNFAMRSSILKLRNAMQEPTATSILAQGANPGFVSSLVKMGLSEMGSIYLKDYQEPANREDWAILARNLDVKVIQISERDHQTIGRKREPNEFINTWSVDGFIAEALQPAELGWGTHEVGGALDNVVIKNGENNPVGAYFRKLGVHTRVRTWTPAAEDFVGWLISHNEAFSISEYLTLSKSGIVIYRPTCYYAYHPCDAAVESMNLINCGTRNRVQSSTVIKEEISDGIDELGVFLISGIYPSIWIGSHLSIKAARLIAPGNNATSLQVVGGVMCGIEWVLANPSLGIIEAEEIDHKFAVDIAEKYWSPIVMRHVNWSPNNCKNLQFHNFLC